MPVDLLVFVPSFLPLKTRHHMHTSDSILFATDGAIATLTLNLPARHNALDGTQLQIIYDHLAQLEESADSRVLIVTGSGEKTFCSGAALDALDSGAISGEMFATMTDRLASLSIPTICAFNGSAYGGGAEIGLACDFRIGFEDMRLYVPPARIGLCYPVNGIERFVTRLGLDSAKRLLLASEEFNGRQLLQMGYLTHLVEARQTRSAAHKLAQRMADYAPLSIKTMKMICNHCAEGSLDKQVANQAAQICNSSEDLQEGFLALREKRQPRFKGR